MSTSIPVKLSSELHPPSSADDGPRPQPGTVVLWCGVHQVPRVGDIVIVDPQALPEALASGRVDRRKAGPIRGRVSAFVVCQGYLGFVFFHDPRAAGAFFGGDIIAQFGAMYGKLPRFVRVAGMQIDSTPETQEEVEARIEAHCAKRRPLMIEVHRLTLELNTARAALRFHEQREDVVDFGREKSPETAFDRWGAFDPELRGWFRHRMYDLIRLYDSHPPPASLDCEVPEELAIVEAAAAKANVLWHVFHIMGSLIDEPDIAYMPDLPLCTCCVQWPPGKMEGEQRNYLCASSMCEATWGPMRTLHKLESRNGADEVWICQHCKRRKLKVRV